MRAGRSVTSSVTPQGARVVRQSPSASWPKETSLHLSQLQQGLRSITTTGKGQATCMGCYIPPHSQPFLCASTKLAALLHCTSHCPMSLAVPSLLQPPWDRRQEGTRLPGPSPHRVPLSPHGALSFLAAPLPLLFSACCTKGAFDLNLSAWIRVQSRSPLPSTEPRQGYEAASAMAGYLGGGSARAVTVAGGHRGEKGQSWLHHARATTPDCDREEASSHEDGLRGSGQK